MMAVKKTLLLLFMTVFSVSGECQELKYDVIKSGKTIGKINLTRVTNQAYTQMKLHSQVKTSLLVKMHLNSWEESHFKNGMLTYSSVIRELNGREQINRQLRWDRNAYQAHEDGKKTRLQIAPISNNIIQLYFEEPVNRTTVFSENQKKWVSIIKTGNNNYKLLLPAGDYNEFFYENGICTKVNVHNTFFKASFLLCK